MSLRCLSVGKKQAGVPPISGEQAGLLLETHEEFLMSRKVAGPSNAKFVMAPSTFSSTALRGKS